MPSWLVDALAFSALVGLVFAPLEAVFPERDEARTQRRTNATFATLGLVLSRLMLVTLVGGALAWLDAHGPDAPVLRASSLLGVASDSPFATALEVAIGLVVFELGGYAYHRLAHAVPALYRLHEVHHSAEQLDWLASFRQHPLEILLATLMQNAPLVLLGVPLGAHALVVILLRVNTVFVHSNVRVPQGPWTSIFATPRFHHRHHQRDGAPKNFATLFPLVDRLFGTYDGERAGRLGLDARLPTGFVGLLLHPFRSRGGSAGRVAATSELGAGEFAAVSPSQHSA